MNHSSRVASPLTGERPKAGKPNPRFVPAPGAVIRVGFALFVASIPLESVLGRDELSLSRVVGSAFFVLALLVQPGVCFRRPPAAFWYFVFFFAVLVIGGYVKGFIFEGAQTLAQLLILLWVASNLLRYQEVFVGTLYTFVASCIVLSILLFAGITTEAGMGRVSALGEDPNSLGAVLSLGLLAVLGLGYGRHTGGRLAKVAAWLCFGIIGLGVIRTGSRGSLVALACGVGVLVLRRGSAWLRFRNMLVVATALAVLLVMASSWEASRRRWLATFERGTLSGREEIYPLAWGMFLERPIMGWGIGGNIRELGTRTRVGLRDTHNLYLWILTEDGVIGAIPYFLGLWLCFRAAWRSRKLSYGLVPLALLSAVLIVNMDVTWQYRKLHWLVLALALASERPLQAAKIRRTLPGGVNTARLGWQRAPGGGQTAVGAANV
jgi:O-antigen ligase